MLHESYRWFIYDQLSLTGISLLANLVIRLSEIKFINSTTLSLIFILKSFPLHCINYKRLTMFLLSFVCDFAFSVNTVSINTIYVNMIL